MNASGFMHRCACLSRRRTVQTVAQRFFKPLCNLIQYKSQSGEGAKQWDGVIPGDKWIIKLVFEAIPGSPRRTRAGDHRAGGENLSGHCGIDCSRRLSAACEPAAASGSRADSITCGNHQALPGMRQRVSHEGPLPVRSAYCIRHGWPANPAPETMHLLWIPGAELLKTVYGQEPYHARVAVSHS